MDLSKLLTKSLRGKELKTSSYQPSSEEANSQIAIGGRKIVTVAKSARFKAGATEQGGQVYRGRLLRGHDLGTTV